MRSLVLVVVALLFGFGWSAAGCSGSSHQRRPKKSSHVEPARKSPAKKHHARKKKRSPKHVAHAHPHPHPHPPGAHHHHPHPHPHLAGPDGHHHPY